MRKSVRAALAAAALALPATAGAQAYAYPSFQPPRVIGREFNFGVADAGDATSLVFQWREGLTARTQLSLDVGFVDPGGEDNGLFLLGGQFGWMLNQATAEMPLDFLATGGLNFAVGDGASLIRIPFGVSIGHRFPLEGSFAITPYVHPRLSIDVCSDCGENGDNKTDLGVDFDIGASFEVSRSLSFRVSALFGGSDAFGDSDGFGISLAYAPAALSRLIRR